MAEQRLARTRRGLSPIRQAEAPIRIFALGVGPGVLSPPRSAGFGQLVTTRSGALTVRTRDACATVTRDFCAWIPASTAYALRFTSRCDLRVVLAREPHAVGIFEMTALLREAVERAVTAGYLDPHDARLARVSAVIGDELAHLTPAPAALSCPLPADPAIRRAIEDYLDAGDDLPSMKALAAAACVSIRTFERRFASETGLPPRRWLRQARLARAFGAIAAGATVTEAGLASGYASTSAFIAAFRASYRTTPGSYRQKVSDFSDRLVTTSSVASS